MYINIESSFGDDSKTSVARTPQCSS